LAPDFPRFATRHSLFALTFAIRYSLFALLSASAHAADQPGQKFNITPASMPAPYATPASAKPPENISRPEGVMPKAPPGFTVSVFASGLFQPRFMEVAPNGDVFLSQPDAGKVSLLHDQGGGKIRITTFANGFDGAHGLALRAGYLYVGDRRAVWRLPYVEGAPKAKSRERMTKAPTLGRPGGHFTRDIAFDTKGALYVAIGSRDNIAEDPLPEASVERVMPDGTLQPYATGTRNPVGIAFYPGTDNLFVTVNERDGLGDGLVPDYLTHLEPGAFYGWPYAYIGNHPDPDFGKKRPDLVAGAKVPDLLFQSHSAPLGLVFYEGAQFPREYKGDAFVALHGSWNSSQPTGYKVVRVHFANGRPAGGYENFLTGFWDGNSVPARVWGRPAGLAIAKDGSLLVADDTGKVIWRVAYTGK
jgi:glucose/arabinose dehydrogenase